MTAVLEKTMRFNGKSAIVTGAASGIGRAVALALIAEGANVTLCDRDGEQLAKVAEQAGACAHATTLDVADPKACLAAVTAAAEHWNGLDILCNIAGVLRLAPFHTIQPAEWDRIVRINLGGTFHMCQAAMPHLVARRGAIVNMASAAGLVGVPYNAAYTASKHGVVGLTKSLALEFATAGVRVNAVCPTGVKTPMLMTPPEPGVDFALLARSGPWLDGGELCDPEDVASAVLYLASAEAKRVTGIALPVDGGQTAN